MYISDENYYKPKHKVVFHKNPLVETIASLHVLHAKPGKEENPNKWLTRARLSKKLLNNLKQYGDHYGEWLLIMDIATYISCEHYKKTGNTEINFDEAMKAFAEIEDVEFTYLFFGMSALGYHLNDAEEWMKHPESIDQSSFEKVGQYMTREDVYIFLKNVNELKKDLENLLRAYWDQMLEEVWYELEKRIDKAIKTEQFVSGTVGEGINYIANLHNGIDVRKGEIILKKEIPYIIEIEDIDEIHIFPSAFSGPEIMMDKQGTDLMIYYDLNLKEMTDEIKVPRKLSEQLKALGDINRLKIVKLIWDSPATTQYLAKVLELAQSTVSVHLKNLKNADLVKAKTVKKYVYYEANQETLLKLGSGLISFLNDSE